MPCSHPDMAADAILETGTEPQCMNPYIVEQLRGLEICLSPTPSWNTIRLIFCGVLKLLIG